MRRMPDFGGTMLLLVFTLSVTVLAVAGFVASATRLLP